jgi:biotin carboxyl carrier protein
VTIEVEFRGRRHRVQVRGGGPGWTIELDGRPLTMDIAEAGDRWSVLIGHRSYEVSFERRGAGELAVHVNGAEFPVRMVDSRERFRRSSLDAHAGPGRAVGPAVVTAPMPGRVVKVLVTPGSTVAARQGVIVIEAMKMENELRAPRAGTVAEIRAVEGSSVEAGAVLVVLD